MNFPIPINSCYFIDNDGDPLQGQFEPESPRHAGGVRILRTPGAGFDFTFNWWLYTLGPSFGDFGPRRIPPEGEHFRRFGVNIGYPPGDRNKYYVMSQPEFDYNQIFTARDNTPSGWMPPPEDAADLAGGADCVVLMSSGPFNLDPGFETSFTIAWLCGENVHNDPTNFEDNFNPYFPYSYLYNLDFSDFALNSLWASWIYDNPGYDTDGDGFMGEYKIICIDSLTDDDGAIICLEKDTIYYTGDGVPDFRAATPPPPPMVRILPGIDRYNHGYLKVRWNGLKSETTPDIFTGDLDFEGYRLKLSLSPNRSDFAPLSSYDLEDYNRYCWSDERNRWLLPESPFTIDRLRELYGEIFDPLLHDIDNFMAVQTGGVDSFYYFEQQDWNNSILTDSSKIFKRFPDEQFPSTLSADSARIHYPEELTDEGYFKYFEYEYLISDLLVSREYFVAVTAFDYGSAGLGLSALETNPLTNMVAAYAQYDAATVEREGLNVIG
jgi:hypothetical protein